jgi:fibronectin-binding autotransporter adhesin
MTTSIRSMMSRAFASLMAAAVAFVAGTAQATTYNWNIATDGTWDTTSVNWAGGSGMWVDGTGNSAVFSNTNLPLRITVSGARAMGSLRVGNAANYGNYSFDGTGGGSLTVNNDAVFSDNNGTVSPVCLLTNLTMSVSGNLKVGRSSLVIGGTSAVTVSGQINAPDDWGYVTIKDSATVIASNGVDCLSKVWGVKLDGGTLITKYIKTSAWAMDGTHDPTLYLNGTTMKAMLSTNTFLTEGYANKGYINAGGAIFDTDGYNIGVGVNMVSNSAAGGLTKLGAGSLTLYGANTYAGITAINGGSLVFSNATAFGNGGSITFGGGTLKYGTGVTTDLAARFKNSTSAVSIDDNGQSISLNNAVDSSNTGGLTKQGSGTLTLGSSDNNYSGATTVTAGTLRLSRIVSAPPTVQNAGFEAPTVSDYKQALNMTVGELSALAWGAVSPYNIYVSQTGSGKTLNVPTLSGGGTQAIGLQQAGCAITQTLSFAEAGAYTLSWQVNGRNGTQVNPYTVKLDGVIVGGPYSWNNSDNTWKPASAILPIMTAGNHTIGFYGLGSGGSDVMVFLDNISLAARNGSLPSATAVALANAGAVLDLNDNNQTIASLSGVAGSTTTVGRAALTMGALTLDTGATLALQLGGTNATAYGRCEVTSGTVNITNSLLSATLTGGYVPKVGDSFTIIRNSAGNDVAGSFANGSAVKVPGIIGIFTVSYTGGTGKDVVLRYRGAGTVVSFM